MRDIPFRRHQVIKHKNRAIRYIKFYDYHQYYNPFYMRGRLYNAINRTPAWEDPVNVGIMATTRQRCRGACCRNARADGGVTRQEYNNWLDTLDEMRDIGYNLRIVKKMSLDYVNKWYYD